MLAFLSRLTRWQRGAHTPNLTVTVYTRASCGCCHQAIDLLRESQRRHGFSIETVDVDGDPLLVERHGLSVPVVEFNGKVRFRGVVNPVLLERLIEAEGKKTS